MTRNLTRPGEPQIPLVDVDARGNTYVAWEEASISGNAPSTVHGTTVDSVGNVGVTERLALGTFQGFRRLDAASGMAAAIQWTAADDGAHRFASQRGALGGRGGFILSPPFSLHRSNDVDTGVDAAGTTCILRETPASTEDGWPSAVNAILETITSDGAVRTSPVVAAPHTATQLHVSPDGHVVVSWIRDRGRNADDGVVQADFGH